MSKGTEAFNNILAEGDFRYFSSLYDRDMFREDVITVKKELEALEIIKRNPYEAIQCVAYEIYEDYILWYNNFAKINPPISKGEHKLLKEVLK